MKEKRRMYAWHNPAESDQLRSKEDKRGLQTLPFVQGRSKNEERSLDGSNLQLCYWQHFAGILCHKSANLPCHYDLLQ